MLEFENLLLRRWDQVDHGAWHDGRAKEDSPPIWAILESSSCAVVGLARTDTTSNGTWSRWLNRPGLAVFESGDEPLVCTVRRRWSWSACWDLRDSDGHVVGRIAPGIVEAALGRFWIAVSRSHSVTEFRDRDGHILATISRQSDDRLLTFVGQPKDDPFARMLMLGAALVQHGI
jgi:hypothetical protein